MDEIAFVSLGHRLSISPRRISIDVHRVVESQHVIATRKLVDSDQEQAILEELIDRVKPPMPKGSQFAKLHYLLFTPFRHPPLRWGSRFGTVSERGIWYGAKELSTCLAEVAFYRLVFLEGSSADLAPVTVLLSSFVAKVRGQRALDLTRAPFRQYESVLAAKENYGACQALGREMRAANIDVFLFRSARSLQKGTNVGLLEPAFAHNEPGQYQSWICTVDRSKVEFSRKTIAERNPLCLTFQRVEFEVNGKLPIP